MTTTTMAEMTDDPMDIVRSIEIPACPAILAALIRETRSDEPDFDRITKLISADVALAAAMLKTVNSPFYGLTVKANSVSKALKLLGLRNVVKLITGLLLRQAFPVADAEWIERFWQTSTEIAMTAAAIAPSARVDRDEAYTYGLFRDCGIPVMLMNYSDYPAILAMTEADGICHPCEIEDQRLDINHAFIGQHLGHSWHLPQSICEAIRLHHEPTALTGVCPQLTQISAKLIAVSTLAEQISRERNGEPVDPDWPHSRAAALRTLALEEGDFDKLRNGTNRLVVQTA